MDQSGSKPVILAALACNTLIAITKFIAASITLSSAMFSEGIHSLVDVGNQGLLLFGTHRAQRPADKQHPFGYGKEIYFWSFIVALLLFSLGGGISFYEGIKHWIHPTTIESVYVNYIVLGLSLCFELVAWTMAFKELSHGRSLRSVIRSIHHSKNPALIVVFLEDSAALIGLVIALIGISLSHFLHMPRLDALASLLIGILLVIVAIWLAYECKAMLIGEAADPKLLARVEALLSPDTRVSAVNNILTMHIGPEEILLNLYVDFAPNLSSDDVEQAVSDFETKIKQALPSVKWVFIAAKSISARKVD